MNEYCCLCLIAILIVAGAASQGAILPPDKPGMAVKIEAGVYEVRGQRVKVASAVELPIAPAERVRVEGEEITLSDEGPGSWSGGAALAKTLGPVDVRTRLPGAIAPESVRVRSVSGDTIYTEDKDYTLGHLWGGVSRTTTGAIPKGEKVRVGYEVYLQRIDIVEASPAGAVRVKQGKSVPVCPVRPEPDAGWSVLAGIWIPFRTQAISAEIIYPEPSEDISWRSFIKVSGREHLVRTLGLLKEGKPVTVVCWGDSVTVGGSASSRATRYVQLFTSALTKAYPNSKLTLINAGIGGSNTDSRRNGFEKEVLAHKPDLITVEFVNDAGFPPEKIASNWAEFISRARAAKPGVEFILLTPHMILPEWMGSFPKAVEAMRKAASDNKVALGDTTNIWANLRQVGIPYMTLLANYINHPNDLGHEFFAATLMELMGP